MTGPVGVSVLVLGCLMRDWGRLAEVWVLLLSLCLCCKCVIVQGESDMVASRLVLASVKPRTRARYAREYGAFYDWVVGSPIALSVRSSEDMDALLVDYLDEFFELNQGRGRSAAGCLVSGINLFYPQMKGCLHAVGRLLKGWKRLRPSEAWPPMSRGHNRLVAYWLFVKGFSGFGLAVLLGFSCLLRISEVLQLKAGDVVFAGDAVLPAAFPYAALIRLGKAKTGEEQSVVVADVWVAQLLKVWMARVGKEALLFDFSSAQLRGKFKMGLEAMGFGSVGYVFHSNRHGRATEEDLLGTPLEDILRMGRWAAAKSGRHYIQSGAAMLTKHRLEGSSLVLWKKLKGNSLGHFMPLL